MAFDNVRLKEEVDKVFAPEEQTKSLLLFLADEHMQSMRMPSRSYAETSFAKNLAKAHDSLPEEDYEKVAEAVTKDARINQFLPYIALNAMGANAFTAHYSEANPNVDTNNAFGISKAELEAASKDNKHFDPVYKKGLAFAADNFDKFRSSKPNDGFPTTWIGGDSNYRNISYEDLGQADEKLVQYVGLPARIRANEIILSNFDAIDAGNNSGKITNGEGVNWFINQRLTGFTEELPKVFSERQMSSSEELSKVDYQTKIASLKKEQAEIAKLWGWEQK